ncbi:MAG: cytochrome c3 family protein [Desulfatitalea sp.]|nr:cytochrome c3 family protein [Desulfatitalea sp.]
MLKKRPFSLMIAIGTGLILCAAAVLYAAGMPEVMVLEAPYKKTRSSVTFTHQKHIDEYKVACGECHHDDQGKPLNDLKADDSVQKCIDCHSKPGEVRGRQAQGMSDQEQLTYHANAMHANCVACHRDYNKEKSARIAPATCNECHPKE